MNSRGKTITKAIKQINKFSFKNKSWIEKRSFFDFNDRIYGILTTASFLASVKEIDKEIHVHYIKTLSVEDVVNKMFAPESNGFIEVILSNYFEVTTKEIDNGKFDEIMYFWIGAHESDFYELLLNHTKKKYTEFNKTSLEFEF